MVETGSTQDGDTLRRAIGSLVVAFADLEFTLAHAVACLIGSQELVARSVVASTSFKALVDMYCTLLPLRTQDGSILKRMSSLRATLASEEDYRNRVVHSFWMPDVPVEGDDGEPTSIVGAHLRMKVASRARKGRQVSVEFVEPGDILAHCTTLNQAGGELIELLPKMPPRVSRWWRSDSHWD
jgi:hypothetical protein